MMEQDHTSTSNLPAGWLQGFTRSILDSKNHIAFRFLLLDDSLSMLKRGGGEECTRWDSVVSSTKILADVSEATLSPVEVRLLNRGHQPVVIGLPNDSNLNRVLTLLSLEPMGQTPMCKQLCDVIEQLRCMEHELRALRKVAMVILMTDCETTDGNLVDVLRPLEDLPVEIIVRVFTDEPAVLEYWHNISSQVDLEIRVVGSMEAEAMLVQESNNSWLTYGEPLHRAREFGIAVPAALNLLEHRQLCTTEIKSVLVMLLRNDGVSAASLPDPETEWSTFLQAVGSQLKALPMVYCPLRKEMRPWVDLDSLRRYEPDPVRVVVDLNEALLWKIFLFYAYNAAYFRNHSGVPVLRLKPAPVFRSSARYSKRLLHQDDLWSLMKDFDFVPTIVNTIRFQKLVHELGGARSSIGCTSSVNLSSSTTTSSSSIGAVDRAKVRLSFREFVKVLVKVSHVAYAHQPPARRLLKLLGYMQRSGNLQRLRDTGKVAMDAEGGFAFKLTQLEGGMELDGLGAGGTGVGWGQGLDESKSPSPARGGGAIGRGTAAITSVFGVRGGSSPTAELDSGVVVAQAGLEAKGAWQGPSKGSGEGKAKGGRRSPAVSPGLKEVLGRQRLAVVGSARNKRPVLYETDLSLPLSLSLSRSLARNSPTGGDPEDDGEAYVLAMSPLVQRQSLVDEVEVGQRTISALTEELTRMQTELRMARGDATKTKAELERARTHGRAGAGTDGGKVKGTVTGGPDGGKLRGVDEDREAGLLVERKALLAELAQARGEAQKAAKDAESLSLSFEAVQRAAVAEAQLFERERAEMSKQIARLEALAPFPTNPARTSSPPGSAASLSPRPAVPPLPCSKCVASEARVSELESVATSLTRLLEEARERAEQVEPLRSQLTAALSDGEAREVAMGKLRDQLAEALREGSESMAQVHTLSAKLAALESQLATSQDLLISASAELKRRETDLMRAQIDLLTSRAQGEELRASTAQLAQQHEELSARMATVMGQLEAAKDEATATEKAMAARRVKVEAEPDATRVWRLRAEDAEGLLDRLTRQLSESEREAAVGGMQKEAAEDEAATMELSRLTQELTRASSEAAGYKAEPSLLSDLTQRVGEKVEKEEENEVLQAAREEAATARAQLRATVEAAADIQAEVERFKGEAHRSRAAPSSEEALVSERGHGAGIGLAEEGNGVGVRAGSLTASGQGHDEQLAVAATGLREQLEAMTMQLEEAHAKLRTGERQKGDLSVQVLTLRQQLAETRARLPVLATEKDALARALAEKARDLKEVYVQISAATSQHAEAAADRDRLRAELERLSREAEADRANHASEIAILEELLTSARSELESLNGVKSASAATEIDTKSSWGHGSAAFDITTVENMKTALAAMNEALRARDREISSLRIRGDALTADLARLQAEATCAKDRLAGLVGSGSMAVERLSQELVEAHRAAASLREENASLNAGSRDGPDLPHGVPENGFPDPKSASASEAGPIPPAVDAAVGQSASELSVLREQMLTKEAELSALREAFAALKKERGLLSMNRASLVAQVEASEEQRRQEKEMFMALQRERDRLLRANDELEAQAAELSETVEEANAQLEEMQQQLRGMTAASAISKASGEKRLVDLESTLAAMNQRLSEQQHLLQQQQQQQEHRLQERRQELREDEERQRAQRVESAEWERRLRVATVEAVEARGLLESAKREAAASAGALAEMRARAMANDETIAELRRTSSEQQQRHQQAMTAFADKQRTAEEGAAESRRVLDDDLRDAKKAASAGETAVAEMSAQLQQSNHALKAIRKESDAALAEARALLEDAQHEAEFQRIESRRAKAASEEAVAVLESQVRRDEERISVLSREKREWEEGSRALSAQDQQREAALERRLKEATDEVERRAEKVVMEVNERLERARHDLETRSKALDDAKAALASLEELARQRESEVGLLSEQLHDAQAFRDRHVSVLEAERAAHQQESVALKRQLSELAVAVQGEKAAMEREMAEMRVGQVAATARLAEVEAHLRQARLDLDGQAKVYEETHTAAATRASLLEASILSLDSEKSALLKRVSELEFEVTRNIFEIGSLRSLLNELEGQRGVADRRLAELEEASHRQQQDLQGAADQKLRAASLDRELRALRDAKAEVDATVEKMQGGAVAREAALASLQAEVNRVKGEAEEVRQNERREAEARLARGEEQASALRRQLAEEVALRESAEGRAVALQAELREGGARLKKDLAQHGAREALLEAQAADLRRQLSGEREQCSVLQGERDRLRGEKEALRRRMEEAHAAVHEAEAEWEQAEAARETALGRLAQAEEALRRQAAEAASLQIAVDRLTEELRDRTAEGEALRVSAERSAQELGALRGQLLQEKDARSALHALADRDSRRSQEAAREAEAATASLRASLQAAEERQDSLEAENVRLAQLADQRLRDRGGEVVLMQRQLEEARAEFQTGSEAWLAQRHSLMSDLHKAQLERQEASFELRRVSGALRRAEAELQRLRTELEGYLMRGISEGGGKETPRREGARNRAMSSGSVGGEGPERVIGGVGGGEVRRGESWADGADGGEGDKATQQERAREALAEELMDARRQARDAEQEAHRLRAQLLQSEADLASLRAELARLRAIAAEGGERASTLRGQTDQTRAARGLTDRAEQAEVRLAEALSTEAGLRAVKRGLEERVRGAEEAAARREMDLRERGAALERRLAEREMAEARERDGQEREARESRQRMLERAREEEEGETRRLRSSLREAEEERVRLRAELRGGEEGRGQLQATLLQTQAEVASLRAELAELRRRLGEEALQGTGTPRRCERESGRELGQPVPPPGVPRQPQEAHPRKLREIEQRRHQQQEQQQQQEQDQQQRAQQQQSYQQPRKAPVLPRSDPDVDSERARADPQPPAASKQVSAASPHQPLPLPQTQPEAQRSPPQAGRPTNPYPDTPDPFPQNPSHELFHDHVPEGSPDEIPAPVPVHSPVRTASLLSAHSPFAASADGTGTISPSQRPPTTPKLSPKISPKTSPKKPKESKAREEGAQGEGQARTGATAQAAPAAPFHRKSTGGGGGASVVRAALQESLQSASLRRRSGGSVVSIVSGGDASATTASAAGASASATENSAFSPVRGRAVSLDAAASQAVLSAQMFAARRVAIQLAVDQALTQMADTLGLAPFPASVSRPSQEQQQLQLQLQQQAPLARAASMRTNATHIVARGLGLSGKESAAAVVPLAVSEHYLSSLGWSPARQVLVKNGPVLWQIFLFYVSHASSVKFTRTSGRGFVDVSSLPLPLSTPLFSATSAVLVDTPAPMFAKGPRGSARAFDLSSAPDAAGRYDRKALPREAFMQLLVDFRLTSATSAETTTRALEAFLDQPSDSYPGGGGMVMGDASEAISNETRFSFREFLKCLLKVAEERTGSSGGGGGGGGGRGGGGVGGGVEKEPSSMAQHLLRLLEAMDYSEQLLIMQRTGLVEGEPDFVCDPSACYF